MPYIYPTARSKRYSKVTTYGQPTAPGTQKIIMSTASATTPQTPLGRGDGLSDLNGLSRTVMNAIIAAGVTYTVVTDGLIKGIGTKANPVYFDMEELLLTYGVVGGSAITALIDSNYPVGGVGLSLTNPFNRALPFTSTAGVIKLTRKVELYANGVNYVLQPKDYIVSVDPTHYCYIVIESDEMVDFVFSQEPLRENRYTLFVGIVPGKTSWTGGAEGNRVLDLYTFVAWAGYAVRPGAEKRVHPNGSLILAVNKAWRDK